MPATNPQDVAPPPSASSGHVSNHHQQQIANYTQSNPQIPPGQWPLPAYPGAVPHLPLQNQPMTPSWPHPNQIPASQSFSSMPTFGPFNAAFFPHQILHDAIALSAPVEASDEPILLQALIDSRIKKESYKDALNGLHGKNGHAASLWKDYYLDHKDCLDAVVESHFNRQKLVLQTAKKPAPRHFKTESSPAPIPRPLPKRRISALKSERSSAEKSAAVPGTTIRTTINSLTTPTAIFSSRLPPPNVAVAIPEPPSHSPTPPTLVIPHHLRGNKFTPQDREFFIKFIQWRLKSDPSLTRQELCRLLAEKAPHHTAPSWNSHWQSKHDLPDKILAAARGEYYGEPSWSGSQHTLAARKRPKYRDPSSSENENTEDDESEEELMADTDDSDDESLIEYSESEMGGGGGSFTQADFYIAASHVAGFDRWETASGKERWSHFSERFPHRAWKSWSEWYRRNDKCILRLAQKIKKRDSKKKALESFSSIEFQRARPTWATEGNNPPQIKRKLNDRSVDEIEDVGPARPKRPTLTS